MPNFETFTKRMVPLSKEPFITIQRKGILSLNASAFALLGSPPAVELLYDPDENIVGLRAIDVAAAHAYPVRPTGANEHTYLVSGSAFTNHYNISTDRTTRRAAKLHDDVLCIDLNEAGTSVTSNRRTAPVVATDVDVTDDIHEHPGLDDL